MTLADLLDRREIAASELQERTLRAVAPFQRPPLDLADEQRRARLESFQNRVDWLKVSVLGGAASVSTLFWWGVCVTIWRVWHVR